MRHSPWNGTQRTGAGAAGWRLALVLLAGLAGVPAGAAEVIGFEDALAKTNHTFQAQPAQEAAWDWAAPATGSLRVAGDFTKVSGTGKAVFEILVAGKSAFRQELEATDAIRHGFDVPLYDLDAGSKVGLRVEAIAGPAHVDAAFSILAEPYLSRWSADLATGYPVWSEEGRKVLREKGQKLLQTIREASAAHAGRVVIPPGLYMFHANWSQASTLSGIQDLEIVAEGVTFWFEPPMVHALLFERCHNVTVRGLTIDFTMPCWFQARVTEVDRSAGSLRGLLMRSYEPRNAEGQPETEGRRAFMFYDAEGKFINHRHSPGAWKLTADRKGVICQDITLSGIPAGLKAGDYVVGTIRTGAALRSTDCAGMRFEDVNVWSSPGVAVTEGGGPGGTVYKRLRATRRRHTNRLHAFGADIFHMAATDRGPVLDRCEMAYGADDNLNIHGSFGRVVQKADARHYYLQGAYTAGDAIEFRDQRSVTLLGVARVLSATVTTNGPSLPIGDKFTAKGDVLVHLDTPLELPPLTLVVLDGKGSSGGFVVRNCWLHDNFQRTLINGSPDGTIENNTLQNVGQGLTIQFETWGPWMEGPFARNLVIRGNRFLDAPPDGGAIVVSMHPPGGGSNARRFEAQPVRNMTILGNDFGRTSHAPMVIHNVDGLTIQGNSIDYPADAPRQAGLADSSTANWVYLQDCTNVVLKGNLSPAGTSATNSPR